MISILTLASSQRRVARRALRASWWGTFMILFLLSLTALVAPCYAASSVTPAQADAAYRQKDYAGAARQYEACLKANRDDAASAQLNYNLGNCYYRLKDYARAVLHYQRALRLDPSNNDAEFNLQLTQAKLTDRFDSPSQMFFVSWFRDLVQSRSSQAWGLWSLALLVLAFVCFGVYRFSRPLWVRKVAFAFSLVWLVGFLATQGFAYAQHSRYQRLQQAVVMQPVDTYDSPTASARKQRTLHEGTTVTLTDTYQGGWLQVALPDGTSVWLKDKGIERVARQ